jgi:hypothetical protein
MKKGLFFLLLAVCLMPCMAFAQKSAVHVDSTINACDSYTWSVTGITYTTSGIRTITVGDTFYILDLTINHSVNNIIAETVNGGCTFTWADSVYNRSGVYSRTFKTVDNCDSVVTITLALSGIATKTYTDTACNEYTWKGETFTTSGTTIKNDNSSSSCDSLLTLNLTIIQPTQIAYDTIVMGCERARIRFGSKQSAWVRVDGTTLSSEDYLDGNQEIFHPRTVERCFDSVVTAHFNILNNSVARQNVKECDEYVFQVNDSTTRSYSYSIVDTITYLRSATNGCDSLHILNLQIEKSPVVSISGDLRVAPGESATLKATADQNVNFLWSTGATTDEITIPSVQGNTDISLTGTNPTSGCAATSYVTILANVAIQSVDDDMVSVYPNPTAAIINISSPEPVSNVAVYNTNGQRLILSSENSVDLSALARGSYIVRIQLENGSVLTRTVVLTK